MRVLPVKNYYSNYSNPQISKTPSFGAQLHINWDAENLIRVQALEVSHGNMEKMKDLLLGFGHFMERVSKRVRDIQPFDAPLVVDLHPRLKKFMELPPITRGTYELEQMCMYAGYPGFPIEWFQPFTYRPGDSSLEDLLVDAAKKLIKKQYG